MRAETLHVATKFKTGVHCMTFERLLAIFQMNCATFRAFILASVWPGLTNKTDKDLQQKTDPDTWTGADPTKLSFFRFSDFRC